MSEQAKYRQFQLTAPGYVTLICWLRDERALQVGRRLRLKDDGRIWTIAVRYEQTLDTPPQKDWKVGGLL